MIDYVRSAALQVQGSNNPIAYVAVEVLLRGEGREHSSRR